IVKKLEMRDGHLCESCRSHFETVKTGLASLNVKFEISSNLVRGLDYYTGTVFEIKHENLGPQQDALGAGGRYDNLVSELGGPETGAIGFAFGVERLLLASEPLIVAESEKLVYFIPLGDAAKKQGVIVLNTLRNAGIPADTDYEGKSLKGAMRKANDLKAPFVLILGDNELQKSTIVVKNMGNGEQKEIPLIDLVKYLSV
ncbi:MAG: ATP phosphoribosyltransferase regulatory subunit, partial [Candidatus Omnitrophica bacterium]|nr:ATP phosphoribosyltransferase regulatory subunit [Candidatus Omnitrophota bacterium]